MKFLQDKADILADGDVSIKTNPITVKVQAAIMSRAVEGTMEGQIGLADYLLRNVITAVTVSGTEYDPVRIADSANLTDDDTLKVLIQLVALVIDNLLIQETVKKKSKQQPAVGK
ncbi:MAG: hypothetical protein R8M45_06465 [Ghiorsea sp.]